jgi:hypothetical protein
MSKFTAALSGVKDAASAEAALPKLEELNNKLDDAKATILKLGDAGKATVKALVQTSRDKLKELVNKVLAIPGAGEKIKTVVDSMMTKLSDLAT